MPPAWPSFTASKRKPIQRHHRTSSRILTRRSSVPSCVVSIGIHRKRPRSALSVAASLLGGDPLVSALAAGETPLPETVAAPGPQGSLRPAVAWACLAGALILIFGASILLAPRNMDWILDRWYAGRAMIALLLPLILLFWGFYVSLGGQRSSGAL